jgi:uncharacterized RDD family membrane protein YckC
MIRRKLEGQYAGFVSRAAGFLLDYAILIVIVLGVGLLVGALFRGANVDLNSCSMDGVACIAGRGFLAVFAMLAGPVYCIIFWILAGQTIGQYVLGVRVVRLDGRRMGFWSSLLRWLGYQLCILTFGIGFLWVLVDDQRRGWHDLIARTCVIYAWKAVQDERLVRALDRQVRGLSSDAEPVEVAATAPPTPVK